jgi:hypothetical protein
MTTPIFSIDTFRSYLTNYCLLGIPRYYSTIILHFQLPPIQGNCGQHILITMLKQLQAEDIAAGRPLLCSIVVRKADGLPGKGFYVSVKNNLGISAKTNFERRQVFRRESIMARRYYRRKIYMLAQDLPAL